MPKYILYYFDAVGFAEPIRYVFHHAGVEFEDHRFQGRDEWQDFKSKNEKLFPFGQVPLLQIDDQVIAQSGAILRFVANEFGLNGKNNMEKAKCDQFIYGVNDFVMGLLPVFREQDAEKKAAIEKEFFENQLPKGLQLYEDKFIPAEGFLLGDKMCVADILFRARMALLMGTNHTDILDKFPKCKALFERVGSCPNIKKYLDSLKK
eukprot:gene11834-13062_t